MSIKHWPSTERPREKLLGRGPHSLSDAELLAIFLRTGHHGLDAVASGRSLLSRFGDLRNLLNARAEDLLACSGIGPAKLALLRAALELGRRYLAMQMITGEVMQDPAATQRFLSAHMRDLPHEVFACLFLDNRHRVLQFEEMFRGTIDGASVYPREVVRRALELNAAAVILARRILFSCRNFPCPLNAVELLVSPARFKHLDFLRIYLHRASGDGHSGKQAGCIRSVSNTRVGFHQGGPIVRK